MAFTQVLHYERRRPPLFRRRGIYWFFITIRGFPLFFIKGVPPLFKPLSVFRTEERIYSSLERDVPFYSPARWQNLLRFQVLVANCSTASKKLRFQNRRNGNGGKASVHVAAAATESERLVPAATSSN
jgi:hypothetical protein